MAILSDGGITEDGKKWRDERMRETENIEGELQGKLRVSEIYIVVAS